MEESISKHIKPFIQEEERRIETVERTNERTDSIYNIYHISLDQLVVLSSQRGSQLAFYCSPDLWQLFLQAARIRGQSGSHALRHFMVEYIYNAAKAPMTNCDIEPPPPPLVTKCLYCSSQATIAARSYNGRYLICEAHFKEHRTRFQSWEKLP